jgi:hypothetical protein
MIEPQEASLLALMPVFPVVALCLALLGLDSIVGVSVLVLIATLVIGANAVGTSLFIVLATIATIICLTTIGAVLDALVLGFPVRGQDEEGVKSVGRYQLLAVLSAGAILFHPSTLVMFLSVAEQSVGTVGELTQRLTLAFALLVSLVALVFGGALMLFEVPMFVLSRLFSPVASKLTGALSEDFNGNLVLSSLRPILILWMIVSLFDSLSTWAIGIFLAAIKG